MTLAKIFGFAFASNWSFLRARAIRTIQGRDSEGIHTRAGEYSVCEDGAGLKLARNCSLLSISAPSLVRAWVSSLGDSGLTGEEAASCWAIWACLGLSSCREEGDGLEVVLLVAVAGVKLNLMLWVVGLWLRSFNTKNINSLWERSDTRRM